jgi:hypothetical protein
MRPRASAEAGPAPCDEAPQPGTLSAHLQKDLKATGVVPSPSGQSGSASKNSLSCARV